jgi:hypothetical protein
MSMQFSVASRNGMADALVTAAGSNCTFKIYSGTPPATAATALSGNTLLATCAASATLAGAASGGVLTCNAVSSDTNAAASGAPTFFRLYKSDGTTCVWQGTAGPTSGYDMNLTGLVGGTTISAGGTVAVANYVTLTMPGA